MDESTSSTHRICSTKKCKTVLPPESIDKAKTCTTCREKDRLRKQTKRATEKRQREEQEHPPSRAAPKKPADNLSGYGNPFNDDSDAEEFSNPSLQYRNADEMGIEDAEKMDEITAEIEELELEDEGEGSDDEDEEGSEAAREISMQHLTYDEQMSNLVRSLHSFADGLAYQVQFRDDRMLDAVRR
ncbi:hypothetical protein DFH05DRAFT_1582089 [Lentinula detonsa]|uniref:Uncharacterized protein n=1 Tax=Lentinula detonsa TaxID=2804962 RepID=A0A9W8NU16_9AGAR|nr:hypothetical protein DFH05DRAFT_1582089 [Lentinula detonsa]